MNRREFVASLAVLSNDWWLPILDEPPVTLFRNPYLQNVQSNSATVMWATLDAREVVLEYSTDGVHFNDASGVPRIFAPSETRLSYPFTQYEAHLCDLSPNTPYVYRLRADGRLIGMGTQTTLRTEGTGPFEFLVLGDSGEATEGQSLVAGRMLLENPAFVVHTGDIAYMDGSFDQYQRSHFAYYSGLMSRAPFFVTPGNHDCETNDAGPYRALHAFPAARVQAEDRGRYYSFDWGNAHFVSIDTNSSLDQAIHSTGRMLQWLEQDLASTEQFWRVVFFHHPPYAGGVNDTDVHSWWARTYVVPILEKYGVQVVLSGHEHSYQRTTSILNSDMVADGLGVVYLTSGGGGARLYPVNPDNPYLAFGRTEYHYLRVQVQGPEMVFRAIRHDGMEFDQFRIAPAPALAVEGAVSFATPSGSPTLIRIQGTALAHEASHVSDGWLAEQLSGTSVSLDDRPALLSYVSNSQVHAVVPEGMSGPAILKLTNANGSVESNVILP